MPTATVYKNREFARIPQGHRDSIPKVVIVRDIENSRIPSTRIRLVLTAIMQSEKQPGTVQVVVVDDVTMRRLNRRFKGLNKTTDVLSFPFSGEMPGIDSLAIIGEIYCNYSHCKRWTAGNGGTIADELLRLAVHGCLHLFGYDHHKRDDQSRMLRAENRYLSQGGLIRVRAVAEQDRDDD